MSVHAGEILTVAGRNVVDRLQAAGLGDARIPIETIREVGNRETVDKVPGEPDFTFTMESLDTSVELLAFLTQKVGTGSASAASPGGSDPDGTEYDWLDCNFVNILSPWKDPDSAGDGDVEAGIIIPGYYPTRYRLRMGVTDNAVQEAELAGGSFFYCNNAAPYEQYETGDGGTTDFVTDFNAIHYRRGGAGGSTFRRIFGVLVDGLLQTEDVDYTTSGGAAHPGASATVSFTTAPEAGADIRFCYFTDEAQSYPQTVHASVVTKPGAVRGRNIRIEIEGSRIGGVQSFELEATVEGEVERELGTEDIVGRSNTGTDCNGSITVRAKDKEAFFNLLQTITGVSGDEVFGWFNDNTVQMDIKIENPRNPGVFLKTIRVADAKFQPPGTPARVNTPTDFVVNWESLNGTFSEFKAEP